MNWENIAFQVSIWTLPILLAVTLHEAAHGWVAWKLGDDTAKRLGRVTFNPFKHIDPFGTILLPAMLLFASGGKMMFGFAKPVPVAFGRLRQPRRDMVLVAAAGPGINLMIAIGAAIAFHALPVLSPDFREWVALNLINMIWINVLLCVFNLIPLPPLDGGRIAVGLLPAPMAIRLARLERVGIFILLAALFILPWLGGTLGIDLHVFRWIVAAPAEALMDLIASVVGIK